MSATNGTVAGIARPRGLRGYESDRPDIQRHVPRDARRILELGCSSGALGAALKARQEVTVVGVEPSPRARRRRQCARLYRVFALDVEAFLSEPLPPEAPFDCLIAADILQHLVDPWSVLARTVDLLSPGATVVVSLPNVAYWRALLRVGGGCPMLIGTRRACSTGPICAGSRTTMRSSCWFRPDFAPLTSSRATGRQAGSCAGAWPLPGRAFIASSRRST